MKTDDVVMKMATCEEEERSERKPQKRKAKESEAASEAASAISDGIEVSSMKRTALFVIETESLSKKIITIGERSGETVKKAKASWPVSVSAVT